MKYILVILAVLIASPAAHALNFIRDTEVETVLTGYARKIFSQTSLNPENAEIILINDDSINAFVAGGQTIFVHTGLITHAATVDDVVFVLSHETGHIVGGHIVRGIGVYEQAKTTALISSILGGLVALAGRPDAGIAVMMGGSSSAGGIFTAYRQTEESAADRIAMDIVQKLNYSVTGFSKIMEQIKAEERLNASADMGYLRTHPMTQDRINALKRFLTNPRPVTKDIRFELIKAKLIGFLYPPEQTFQIYANNTTPAGDYARAIALYRAHRLPESFALIDKLIASKPDYPYFHELKGQFLFETGQVAAAIPVYRQAVSLMPKAPLIRLSLAQALLETTTSQNHTEALNHLEQVVAFDDSLPFAWQLLSTAYERTGNADKIPYAMAELYRTGGDLKKAKKYAKQAVEKLQKNTPIYQKAQDILSLPEPREDFF